MPLAITSMVAGTAPCEQGPGRGDIGALERRDYPEPLVNHKSQQAKFKALYATIRS